MDNFTCCILAQPDLHTNKGNRKEPEKHEQRNDPAVTPRVLDATPLKGKEQADNCRNEKRRPDRIES